jgi:phosphate transport system protein
MARTAYHDALDEVTSDLVEMADLVGSAMNRATAALLEADLTAAETVIAQDQEIDLRQKALEAKAFDLLALHQPMATDLRTVVTSLRMSADFERMGDLARHIAKVARMRYPDWAIPPAFRGVILEMNALAVQIAARTGAVIAEKNVAAALDVERHDDAMDNLHRRLFEMLLDPSYDGGIETAIDVTLCGRYYERFADHAVSVARRVVYLVTGEKLGDVRV